MTSVHEPRRPAADCGSSGYSNLCTRPHEMKLFSHADRREDLFACGEGLSRCAVKVARKPPRIHAAAPPRNHAPTSGGPAAVHIECRLAVMWHQPELSMQFVHSHWWRLLVRVL